MALRTQLAVNAAVRLLTAQFDQQRQQALITRLRLLSPAVFVQQSLRAVAGTDATRYLDFQAQVQTFGQRFEQYFGGKVFRRELLHAADYPQLPTFHYQPLATQAAATASLINLGWLLTLTLLLTVLGLATVRSIRVGPPGSRKVSFPSL